MALTVTALVIPEDTVVKIATDIQSGVLNRHNKFGRKFTYLCAIKPTGGAAPTVDEMKNLSVRLFQDHPEQETISSTVGIDVYIMCGDGGEPEEFGRLTLWGY